MLSTFTDDVVHYFVDHSAVRGAQVLANYWAKVAPRTQANWQLDHALVQDSEAVIEWSMQWVPQQTGQPELLRGTEWYVFAGDKIAEIRSYHNNYYLQDPANRQLHGFDYTLRGYRTH
jgi:SnoaL-like protein